MVPADSRRIPRVLRYSGGGSPSFRVSPTGLSPASAGVPTPFGYALPALPCRSYYPGGRVATPPVWAPPLSLAATGGIICLFSFPAGTEMFQFPALAPLQVVSLRTGSPIRTPADHAVFAGPRGFSQLVTSFFASGSLRHPPCALLRFPYAFSASSRSPFRDCGRRLRSLFVSRLLSFRFRFFRVCIMSMDSSVVSGRVELPTSTLSV